MATKSEKKVEFQRHKKEIEENYHRKMDALYELYPEFKISSPSTDTNGVTGGYGSLKKALNQAIENREGEFTSRDIKKWIAEIDPTLSSITPASLSNALARLEGEKIEKIKKGAGSSPSIYKRKN